MREAALPTPGPGSKAMHLRRIAANHISSIEVTMNNYTTGAHPDAAKLVTFFNACSAAAAEAGKNRAAVTLAGPSGVTSVAVSGTLSLVSSKGGSAGAGTFTSSNTAVATVNSSGHVTGVAAGTAVITYAVAGTSTYRPGSASLRVTVTA